LLGDYAGSSHGFLAGKPAKVWTPFGRSAIGSASLHMFRHHLRQFALNGLESWAKRVNNVINGTRALCLQARNFTP
jgi:hypothetical protein